MCHMRDMMETKGHGAFRCCDACPNVILRRWWIDGMSDCVDHTCTGVASIQMHTADSFADVIRRLRYGASHLSIGNCEELQLVHGVHYVPEGILFADDLAVTPLNCMNDWVHTYLHGGLVDVEFGLLMKSMAQGRAPVTYAALGEYVRLWQWPKSIKRNGPGFAQLFTKDAARKY